MRFVKLVGSDVQEIDIDWTQPAQTSFGDGALVMSEAMLYEVARLVAAKVQEAISDPVLAQTKMDAINAALTASDSTSLVDMASTFMGYT